MRLHQLTVTAFGPFPDTQRVDFDALAADGLFLLRGATGAGKTSVLDAVCYALYGMVPGARPRTRLRSDHARPEVRTEVVLEVTLGGRRLEITRIPEQLRPKKRGSGSTPERAQTLLREWSPTEGGSGGWRASSKSHQEIGAEVQQLLGMNREQFCQVVLLPQGEFARFLQAGAQERADLLGRLFDTARFGAVEGWLVERRQRSEKACQAVRGDIAARLERISEAAGSGLAEPADAPAADDPDADALGWAAQLRVRAREELELAGARQQQAALREQAAAERARGAEVLAERQQRRRRAAQRLGALEAGAEEQRAAEDALERAQRAEAVVPLLRLHEEAEQRSRRLAAEEQEARLRLPEALRAADGARLQAREGESRESLGGLRALVPAEAEFEGNRRLQKQWTAEHRAAEERRTDAEQWLADWPELRAAAEERSAAAGRSAVAAEQFAEQLSAARARLEAAATAESLAAELTSAEAEQLTLREEAVRTGRDWLDLRRRRLDGMAAELAAGLSPGADCPVCGSTEHPRPAPVGPDQVTQEQEQRAEQAHQEAERRSEAVGRRVQQLGQDVARLGAVAGDRSAQESRAEVERLDGELARAQRSAADGVRAQEELDRLEREQRRRSAESEDAARSVATARAELHALDTRQTRLDAELTQGRAGAPSVAVRIAELDRLVERLARAGTAVREAAAGAQALAEAGAATRAAAEREGFADPAAAARAVLPPERTALLREGVRRHGDELRGLRAELDLPELLAAARSPLADPQAGLAEHRAAEAALREAFAAERRAGDRCEALDRLGRELEEDLRRLAPLAADHDTVAGLAALASGTSRSNTLKMSLETFVLAARLEQVAAAAGVRLAVMSEGRYTLVHNDARGKGTGRSGLGLSVVDAWTGQERDTSTLSGGESFFASLALALGLADVVTDEAGGMPLDTLFIDEGFGSLDEDTLEKVLDVLDRLRERDRAVGIVSHVADLRLRIPAQLEVRKGRTGSVLRRRGAEPPAAATATAAATAE